MDGAGPCRVQRNKIKQNETKTNENKQGQTKINKTERTTKKKYQQCNQ